MVKLFRKKSQEEKKDLKFEASLKLKSLSLEEYTHVAYAFQVSLLRFERMLKESLLEGYITSTTLEKISQEFNFLAIRNLEIPQVESLATIFGVEAKPDAKTPKLMPKETQSTSIPEPVEVIEPEVPSEHPIPSLKPQPTPVSQPLKKPSFTFSVPEPVLEPTVQSTTPSLEKPSPKPAKPVAPPIPKISFPTIATSSDPLGQVRARREEDRATGIAILRKQMLTELKKIRTVVSEDQQ
ncbi:MAG: hypothetical protein EAX86_05995 [Candidatus Heimdallarchaeota archaeon]|nr:hypothetical protein [Candidatus Heimdallarchaeota archaeon]